MKKGLSLALALCIFISMFAGLNITANASNRVEIGIGTQIDSDSGDTYFFTPKESGTYLIATDGCGYITALSDWNAPIWLGYTSDKFIFCDLYVGATYELHYNFYSYYDDLDKRHTYSSFTITDIQYLGQEDIHLVDMMEIASMSRPHLGDELTPEDFRITRIGTWATSYSPSIVKVTDCFFADVPADEKYLGVHYSHSDPDWEHLTRTADSFFAGDYWLIAKIQLPNNYYFNDCYFENPMDDIFGTYGTECKIISNNEAYLAVLVSSESYTDENSIEYTINGKGSLTASGLSNDYAQKELTIPENVTIAGEAFTVTDVSLKDNATVEKVTLPKTVTSIAYGGFANFTSLNDVEIPENVKSIEVSAFSSCTSLEEIKVNRANEDFSEQDGVVYSANQTKLVRYPAGKCEESFTVPESVKTIEAGAFATSDKTKEFILPNTVEEMGYRAFLSTQAQKVTLSNKLKTVYSGAFEKAERLKSILIPEGIESIGYNAFKECKSLESIYLPKSLGRVNAAFEGNESLKDIYYAGSREEWQQVSVEQDSDNESFIAATVHYNYTYELPHEHLWDEGEITTAPTCTERGVKTYTCECGQTKTESIPATGHSFEAAQEYCLNGCGTKNPEYTPPHSHNWGSGEVTTAPTCTAEGEKTYTCACGETKTESIPATGHKFTAKVVPASNQVGYTYYECAYCGESYYSNYVAPVQRLTGLKCAARTAQAVKVAWEENPACSGYQVQISNAAGNKWGSAKVVKTNSYVFKGLAAGSNYKFRVRYYKAVGKKVFYSPWSKTLSSPTLPRGTTLTKLVITRNSFEAFWNRGAVNGYQIQYATNAKFAGAKLLTVRNPKLYKAGIGKLSANKVYYVRIRTYKTINKVNHFSAWSKLYLLQTL